MTLSYAIRAKRDDLIALTQDLIRIPTLNPPGQDYRLICEYLDKRLHAHGFHTELIRAFGTPGDSDKYPRWNIIAHREGTHSGECVHFNSHTDVVEVGAGWTFDPFDAEIADGKIYGRGACDMKGGLAASIIAVEAFIEQYPDFCGAIEGNGVWQNMVERVELTYVNCNFGNQRPYFVCPGTATGQACKRRVGKLFFGGSLFLCRHCLKVAYSSQSETPQGRMLRKANKLRATLGGDPAMEYWIPCKPKGMWQRTYERRLARIKCNDR